MNAKTDLFGELQQLHLQLGEIETRDDVEIAMSPEEAKQVSEAARNHFENLPQIQAEVGKDETTSFLWYDDYLRLKEMNFTWRVAAWIAWAASPKRSRWPKTQMEFANIVAGLSTDRAIGNWRKNNPAIDETVALLQAAPLLDYRRDIYTALAKSASNDDHRSNPDRKLALEILGDYVPHMTVEDKRKSKNDTVSSMSDAELDEAEAKLLKKQDPTLPSPSEKPSMERNEITSEDETSSKFDIGGDLIGDLVDE